MDMSSGAPGIGLLDCLSQPPGLIEQAQPLGNVVGLLHVSWSPGENAMYAVEE